MYHITSVDSGFMSNRFYFLTSRNVIIMWNTFNGSLKIFWPCRVNHVTSFLKLIYLTDDRLFGQGLVDDGHGNQMFIISLNWHENNYELTNINHTLFEIKGSFPNHRIYRLSEDTIAAIDGSKLLYLWKITPECNIKSQMTIPIPAFAKWFGMVDRKIVCALRYSDTGIDGRDIYHDNVRCICMLNDDGYAKELENSQLMLPLPTHEDHLHPQHCYPIRCTFVS